MFAEFIRDRTHLQDGPDLTTEKANYAAAFVQRAEFLEAFPLQQNREQFIAALLLSVRNSSGLDLSSKTNELLSEYNSGTNQNDSRARVILKLIEYAEYRQAEFNAAFVLAEYFGFLRRDIDESGYAFWLDILNNSEPNSYLDMICGFVTSTEYQQRFSPVITRSNRDCGQ
jgi:hypothetical protein